MGRESNTVEIGREWEKEAQKFLEKKFEKVVPLFQKRLKVDFEVFDRFGVKRTVERKTSNGDFSLVVNLMEKDLGADYLLLKLKDKVYFYRRIE